MARTLFHSRFVAARHHGEPKGSSRRRPSKWSSRLPTWLTARRRPSLRFSLLTLLVAVTVVALVLGWQMRLLHARRAFKAANNLQLVYGYKIGDAPNAPRLLWLYGEDGYYEVWLRVIDRKMYAEMKRRNVQAADLSDEEALERAPGEMRPLLAEAKRLFPEAKRVGITFEYRDPRKPPTLPTRRLKLPISETPGGSKKVAASTSKQLRVFERIDLSKSKAKIKLKSNSDRD